MKKILCLLTALVILLCFAGCELTPPEQNHNDSALRGDTGESLTVHFIDVGQGDSILLESDGEFVLVDAGDEEHGGKVTEYLRRHGAERLKYVIATHPHTDHIGGMAQVIDSVPAEHFITCETDQQVSQWRRVLKAVEKNDVDYIDAEPGAAYAFGSAEFTILAPLSEHYEGYNNCSVVTMVRCGSVRFLLTGDAETDSEREMLDAYDDLRADVLKCGHHGSSDACSEAFLIAVDPACAVISCGRNNDYGHPHRETLEKLRLMDCPYLRTDLAGTIVAETDGERLSITGERGSAKIPAISAGERKADTAPRYIGNRNSRIFHYYNCPGVGSMKEKNKIGLSTREQAISEGFTPCPSCQP